MKKLILFAAILFAGVSVVKAEGEEKTGKTGTVNFQLNLHAFQSIEIGGGDEGTIDSETGLFNDAVVLNYNTVERYESGVSRTINDHIKIKTAGGFAIKVSSTDNLENDINGGELVSMSTIALTAQEKGLHKSDIENGLTLSSEPKTFISSGSGLGKEISYNVTYTGADKNAYGKYVDATGATRELTTTVTYEIVPG